MINPIIFDFAIFDTDYPPAHAGRGAAAAHPRAGDIYHGKIQRIVGIERGG